MRPYSTLARVCLESLGTELFLSSFPQSRKGGGTNFGALGSILWLYYQLGQNLFPICRVPISPK